MAEILATVGVLMTFIELTEKTYRILHQINRVKGGEDTRLETLRLNVDTEFKTFNAWTSNVAANRVSLTNAAKAQVEHAKTKMLEINKKAEAKFNGYLKLSAETVNSKGSLGFIKALPLHLRFEARGYDELKDMVALMRALNNNLQTLVPTTAPPPYLSSNSQETAAGQLATQARQTFSQESTAVISGSSQSRGESTDVIAENSGPTVAVTSEPLWNVCWQTMQLLADSDISEQPQFQVMTDRLLLWSSGIGENPFSLEALQQGPVHDCVRSYMIELLLAQELYLANLGASEIRFENAKSRIQAALASIDVADIALEQWAAMLADEMEVCDEGISDVTFLEGLVDLLYHILPGIRLATHQQVLKNERSDNVAVTTDVTVSTTALEDINKTIQRASVVIPAGPRLSKSLTMLQLYSQDAATDPALSQVLSRSETQKVLLKLEDALTLYGETDTIIEEQPKAEDLLGVLEQTVSYLERARSSEVETGVMAA